MGNHKYLDILRQGVKAWNKWRKDNPEIKPDLSDTDLSGIYLSEADLNGADLSEADLSEARLTLAHLNRAVLIKARLSWARLSGANLTGARLGGANIVGANLNGANLNGADLSEADLSGADLSGVNLSQAKIGKTTFADNDLSTVKGLETVHHIGPSTIGVDILLNSKGQIPEVFLRGCGFSDWQIETVKLYQPALSNEAITDILYRVHDLRAHQAIQINPLFISYSHTDSLFVDALEKYLNQEGIRFWRDVHHATAGRLETQVDRAIRVNPTVLLVLSADSVKSDWVQHEARLARKLEIETKRDVLCPIALDESWKSCDWPERLREQIMEYNILNFSTWKSEASFHQMFARLISGLDMFYK